MNLRMSCHFPCPMMGVNNKQAHKCLNLIFDMVRVFAMCRVLLCGVGGGSSRFWVAGNCMNIF